MATKFSLNDRLRTLHATEVIQLSTTHAGRKTRQPKVLSMLKQYVMYLSYTWGNVFRSIMFLSLNPIDFAIVLGLAIGCSILLGVALLSCIMLKSSRVQTWFANWSQEKGHGLNPVNAPGNIFRQITQNQVDAARTALEQPPVAPPTRGARTFNVDIAKLLLQLSALMYERGSEPVLSALAASHAQQEAADDAKMPSPSSTIHDLATLPHGDLTPVPSAISSPLNHNAEDGAIRAFCHTFGLDYAPVSELNASDSAYAALFWDPHANWIAVAFKGTSPAEYSEWVSDFNYTMADAGDWLPGFSQVHGGFLQRIFPYDVSQIGGFRPWDTIIAGIRLVTEDLRKKNPNPDAKINVYFTGHSLGCAIASLAYARAVLVEKDLGDHVVVRDGYLFAAPIVCDVASVKAFDGAINASYDMPKTLWRVTNMDDIVATGLPDFGDRKDSRFLKNSLLNFAHLGAEIRMRSKPTQCQVAGWPHITRGLPVVVTSNLPADLVGTLGVTEGMPPSALILEKLPLVGRCFQHATSFYWDQLQRMGVGPCQWAPDN